MIINYFMSKLELLKRTLKKEFKEQQIPEADLQESIYSVYNSNPAGYTLNDLRAVLAKYLPNESINRLLVKLDNKHFWTDQINTEFTIDSANRQKQERRIKGGRASDKETHECRRYQQNSRSKLRSG